MYCGEKDPPPKGRTKGTPNACFKKGIAVGFAASNKSGTASKTRIKAARVAGEAAATARLRKKIPKPSTNAGTQTSAKRQTAARAAIEAAATAKGRSEMRQKVVKEGLPALKNELRLDALGMAELQSLAKREHAKRKFDETWSKYTTKEQFKNLLTNRGYQR